MKKRIELVAMEYKRQVFLFILSHLMMPISGFFYPGSAGRNSLETNCTVRESCLHQQSVKHEKLYLCRCDEECHMYDDCCFDAPALKQGNVNTAAVKAKAECVLEKRIQVTEPIYMVKSCPAEFANEYITAKCEGLAKVCKNEVWNQLVENVTLSQLGQDDGPGMSSLVPVTGNKSGILYRNMYCALCNEEDDFKFWILNFMSGEPIDADILNDTELLQTRLVDSVKGGHKLMGFTPPEGYNKTRQCKQSISVCSGNDTDSACLHPTSYVYVWGKAYKNKNCALCNGEKEEDIGCVAPQNYLTSTSSKRRRPPSVARAAGGSMMPPPSFALLLDFNLGMGQFAKQQQKVGLLQIQDVILPMPASCDRHGDDTSTIYDPLTGRCVHISCPPGFQLSCGEQCRPAAELQRMIDIPKFGHVQGYLTLVGNILSITGLMIQLAVYCYLPNLRNTPGKCLMCLSSWLLISLLIFTFGTRSTRVPALCYTISVVLHFGFLSSFFWMNVMAYDVWRALGNASRSMLAKTNERKNKSFIIYFSYATLAPLVIVVVSIILDQTNAAVRPHYAGTFCLIEDLLGGLLLFAVPMMIIMVINLVFFILTARNICITSDSTSLVRKEKTRAGLYAKLALIMGLTWTSGIVAQALDRDELWFIFILLNAFQGVFICVSFVCTRKVFRSFSDKMLVYKRSRTTSDIKTASTKQTYVLNESDLKFKEVDLKQPLKCTQY